MANKVLVGVQIKKPSLDKFDEKITYLQGIKHSIEELTTSNDLGWLKVNSAPLKSGIQNIINSWIKKYTSFLLDNTMKEITNIEQFIHEVDSGIKEIPQGAETKREKELLMKVMTHLRDVKMIKDKTIAEVDPMKNTVVLLKKHGVAPEGDLLIRLENQKTKLIEVSENALGPVKEQILPLQSIEANNIKVELEFFRKKIEEFRRRFIASCPYHVETATPEVIDKAYNTISQFYAEMIRLEDEAKSFNNLETLFELHKSQYKELKECRNELINLKYLWDLVSLVEFLFTSWRSTLWDKIDTDSLMAQIKELEKKLTNPLNSANKEIKGWKAFMQMNQ